MGMLPEDMEIEILCRLPPRPFFRCRAVCKSWLSLSSDALHINKHIQSNLSGLFYNKFYYTIGFFDLHCGTDKLEVDEIIGALSSYDYLQLHDCCNGLLPIDASNKKARLIHDLYVYNPTTHSLFTVLSFEKPLNLDNFHQAFSLAFDPQVCTPFYIVCFTSWWQNEVRFSFMYIFSFEKGKCISRRELAYDATIHFYRNGSFVDGQLYRIITQNDILSIDPEKCCHEVIRRPHCKDSILDEIGQSEGHLHCLSLNRKDKVLNIWVLQSHATQE